MRSISLEKVYKAISKALGLQRTTVRSHLSTMAKTWNSGEPSQEWPADQNYPKSDSDDLIQEVTKDPTTTSKELQASLASVKVMFMTPPEERDWSKNGLHGEYPRPKNRLLSKKNIKPHLSFARKHLDDPQDFWENTL